MVPRWTTPLSFKLSSKINIFRTNLNNLIQYKIVALEKQPFSLTKKQIKLKKKIRDLDTAKYRNL